VSSDSQLQPTLDRILSAVQVAVEDTRRQADIEIAQLREMARREAEEARRSAEAQIADLRRMLEDIRLSTQQQVDDARKSLDSGIAAVRAGAEAEIEEARRLAQTQVEDVQRANDSRIFELMQELTASREQGDRDARLLAAFRAMDEAPSLAAVLERLAQFAGREVDRAAILIVKSDLLYAWHLIGFELEGEPTHMDVPIADRGLLGTAVRECRVVVRPHHHPDLQLPPPFVPPTPSRAVGAFPVTVAGDVVAVLYADAPESSDDGTPEWCHRVETLTRSASRILEALTVELAMGFRPLLVQPSHGASGRQLSEDAQ
jgi:hypothetical protein